MSKNKELKAVSGVEEDNSETSYKNCKSLEDTNFYKNVEVNKYQESIPFTEDSFYR